MMNERINIQDIKRNGNYFFGAFRLVISDRYDRRVEVKGRELRTTISSDMMSSGKSVGVCLMEGEAGGTYYTLTDGGGEGAVVKRGKEGLLDGVLYARKIIMTAWRGCTRLS